MQARKIVIYNDSRLKTKGEKQMKVFAVIAIVLVLGTCAVVGLNYMENYDEFFTQRLTTVR